MKYPKLSAKISSIIQGCNDDFLNVVNRENSKPLKFNQRQTVSMINCYINDQFYNREDGIFWNISTSRRTHTAKLIGADTKDFLPYGIGEHNMVQSWGLRKKLRNWFDETAFYRTLNSIPHQEATYGSTIQKLVKDDKVKKFKKVDLLDCYFDQSVEKLCDSDGFVQVHHLNKTQIMEKDGVWDNVDKLYEKCKEGRLDVEEYWGWYKDGDSKPEYIHVIKHGAGDDYLELWSEESSEEEFEKTYKEFHIGEYEGRWLRRGVVEKLFKLQSRANQLVNQNAQATEIASLLLLQTSNPDMVGNVLEQAINGQIIPDETLKQIGISNTGLGMFIQELQLIEAQADKICFTPEIIQGESSPSNTTVRGQIFIGGIAKSAFTDIHQNFVELMAHILMEDVLPDISKEWNREQVIEMSEDDADVEQYDKAVLELMKREYLLNVGMVTPEVEQRLMTEIENGMKQTGRRIKLPEKWLNFKWGIKMTPSTETVDKNVQNSVAQFVIGLMNGNPAILNTPYVKQYLEDNGVSWWKLTPSQIQQIAQGATGGSIPVPAKPDTLLAQANV